MIGNTNIENANFLSDNETYLSPKSDAEKLFIDESIDHSIMDHSTLTDDLMENEKLMDTKEEIESKININKKTRKQQCFTCGKVMSSRQVIRNMATFCELQNILLVCF